MIATHKTPIFFVFICALMVLPAGSAHAGVSDVLFGVASSQDTIDFSAIDASNFDDSFSYTAPPTASMTIGGQVEAQIGAIWTGGSQGQWRQIRIIVDSNGDGNLTPFDWSDPSHPWNPPGETPSSGDTWTYTYPDDYPRTELRGETITVELTIDDDGMWFIDFPWDTWEHWWYEGNADKTDNWWMESGQLMNVWWSGRDQNWTMLPNGNYKVQVWVDEDDDGEFESGEANQTMVIAIETAGITGTVIDSADNPIMGARVEAGSHMAWGETRTASDGTFTISGLQAGADYHLRVQSTGKVTHETTVTLAAGESTADAGIIAMDAAVTISGTLKLDRDADGVTDEVADQFAAFTNQWGWDQQDMWVWVDAHNTRGPGWGNADARFEVGDNAVAFDINIPPPTGDTVYHLNVHADGYVATINDVAISSVDIDVSASGGNAGTIVLTKASRLSGSVKLPEAITEWKHIDVQAVSNSDSDARFWGWGSINPTEGGGSSTDTGNFSIDGIPAGTYRLEIRVMGYAAYTAENVTVVQGQDKDMGQLTISEGSRITGTLTIQGDTTGLTFHHGDSGSGNLNIWLDAWSHSGGWSGTNLQVARGANQTVNFTLGGLSDATYELHCWLGEGYELVDEYGEAPVFVSVSGNTAANLVLKPHEGRIQGMVTGDGISVDLSKVVVEVKRPWDWLPPKVATVANGGINASTGAYVVSGLGTGDYVVKAGVYQGFMSWGGGSMSTDLSGYNGDGFLVPNSSVGVSMQRSFVENNANNPTTLNLRLQRGYSISGTVALSTSDAPWHDFGDGNYDSDAGSFGDANGRKDTHANPLLSEEIGMVEDIAGQQVMALPMDMMFMGGQDPRMGTISYDSGSGVATYRIDGLSPGVYMIQPPFNSNRISQLEGDSMGDAQFFDGGQDTHHWTATTQMVVISDDDVENVDFTFGNGYTVTGQITLPEAQTYSEDWEAWNWVGHLELETAQHQFMGHGKPLMKRDFEQGSRYSFTFNHVANGDYMVRFWTDRYVPGGSKFSVNNASASVNLTIESGANLVGKLVDADTGEAVTGDDGVRVRCEATPHVEGSWRETRDDQWSQSYIENGDDLQNSGSSGDGQTSRTNNTPGRFHLTALPTGHKYVIVVETTNGKKTNGAKNYVGRVIAGIEIPEGASGDINVGTIQLKEGTTIQGRLTDSDGNPIPGVDVFAMPSDTHDGSAEAEGISDTQGYFTVYGINPDVAYYDLIAAERPDMFDDWGKQVEWGEKRKYNVAPETTDANFTLNAATAALTGTITIPGGSRFMVPFKNEANDFPATVIMLQRKGVIYKDVMDGIEVMSTPAPDGAISTTYTIDNIAPGTYKAIFMNYGLPTRMVDNVVVEAGSNTLNLEWTSAGYTVSGDVALSSGGYPGSADISGVICMNTNDQSLTFGQLTQEADGSYSAYEVPGLASGDTYQLVFYRECGFDGPPEIFTVGSPFTVTGNIADNTATITRESVPVLMAQAVQDPSDSDVINIGIFSTSYLSDSTIDVVTSAPTADSTTGEIYVETGGGSLSNVVLSGDKRSISASYTKGVDDATVELSLAVHYGDDDSTFLETIRFNVNTLAKNEDSVSVYIPGQVKLGNGDASQIYVPAGSLDTSDDGTAIVTIEKTNEEPGNRSGASRKAVNEMGIFARTATEPLPADATAAGPQYEFNLAAAASDATVEQVGTVVVQIQYDPDLTEAEIAELQVKHLVNGEWVTETTNRSVDTENYTISVEVTSLSPFIAAVVRGSGDGDSGATTTTGGGGGGGGGCFISASASELSGVGMLMLLCLLSATYGIKLLLHAHGDNSKTGK